MNKKWKRLSTKQLLHHHRIEVFEDEVKLPTGHITDYIHLGVTANITSAIAVRDDGKILVQKEYSYLQDEWLYHLPGGIMEEGETPEEGVARELAEETGLKAADLDCIGWFYLDNRRRVNRLYVFVVNGISEATKAEKDLEEQIEVMWLTAEEIDTLIRDGEIVVSNFLSAWSIYKARSR